MTLVINAAFAYLIILVSETENDGNCCLSHKPVTNQLHQWHFLSRFMAILHQKCTKYIETKLYKQHLQLILNYDKNKDRITCILCREKMEDEILILFYS